MLDLLKRVHDDFRVMPKIIFCFVAGIFYKFTYWLTGGFETPVADLPEFAVVQWGIALAAVIGFAKFYMETGNNRKE